MGGTAEETGRLRSTFETGREFDPPAGSGGGEDGWLVRRRQCRRREYRPRRFRLQRSFWRRMSEQEKEKWGKGR